MRLGDDRPSRLARLTFTLLLAYSWCGPVHIAGAAAEPVPGAARPPATRASVEDLQRIAAEMERGFAALEVMAGEVPRDTFDPRAIVDRVGKDPVRLFEWVRDNTHWVPYRGALRGPSGVLSDRLGSSLDRSLLLAELLRIAGHRARLARAELPERTGSDLLAKVRGVPKDRGADAAVSDASDDPTAAYARKFGLDARRLRRGGDQAMIAGAKLAEDAAQRVAGQTARLVELLASGPADADQRRERAEAAHRQSLDAIRDHWWVQRGGEGGAWVDLDPLLPDAAAGSPVAPAPTVADVLEPDGEGRLRLDGRFCHEVRVRILIEQSTRTGRREREVFDHTLRPSELAGESIRLVHIPTNWPKGLNLLTDANPIARLRAAVLAQDQWVPALAIGARVFGKAGFLDSGDVNERAMEQFQELFGLGVAGDRVKNILGGGRVGGAGLGRQPGGTGAGTGGANKTPDGALTAEWIEYEIRVPGRPPQVIRRQVFDLVGPAARRSAAPVVPPDEAGRLARNLALAGEVEILPLASQVSPEFVAHLSATSLLSNRAAIKQVMTAVNDADLAALPARFGKVAPPPGELHSYAVARSAWSRARGDVYLDRPNIVTRHAQLGVAPDGQWTQCRAFDVVANELAVRPGAGADPFRVRLEQGVLDTNVEALLSGPCGVVESVATSFQAAGGAGTNWLTVRGPRDPALQSATLAPDIRARIEADLAAGYAVVMPAAAPGAPPGGDARACWWRVDPRTGDTLGIGRHGWGEAATEYSITLDLILVGLFASAIGFGICFAGSGVGRTRETPQSRRDVISCAISGTIGGFGVAAAVVTATPGAIVLGIVAVGIFILNCLKDGIDMNPHPGLGAPFAPGTTPSPSPSPSPTPGAGTGRDPRDAPPIR